MRVRVADSLPDASGGPGEAISEPIIIGIDRGAKSLLEQTLAQQQAELQLDMGRLWRRNLGRDDRLVADLSREARHPFLDEDLLCAVAALPLWLV